MATFYRVAAAALFVGLLSAAVHGCTSVESFDSLCLWVADPNNCYRELRVDSVANGETCKPLGDPSPVNPADVTNPNGTANGAFATRDKLDVCFITDGGQVVFDPPIDLAGYPPSPMAEPITYKMTFKRANGTDCGSASYTSPHGFSFTINAPPNSGATASTDADGMAAADAGPAMAHGSYTQVIQPGRDAFDVTCPTGESHHMNLVEAEGASSAGDAGTQSQCPLVAQLVPHAAIAINPGGIGIPGAVSFTIYWPPIDIAYPTNPVQRSGTPLEPTAVTYFNCSVAAAPRPCEDGVRDLNETDVDCGGPEMSPGCPVRCGAGLACLLGTDCKSGVCTSMLCM